MNTIKLAIRNTFRKTGNNLVKLLSLGIGLTIGLVLIAKILFELSYDSYFSDSDRIYNIYTNYAQEGEEMEMYEKTPGAIAWGMKNEISEVENATRYTALESGIYNEKREYIQAESILADENLFDVLNHPVLIGDAKTILSTPMHCLVSKTLAEKIGMENIVGKTITLNFSMENPITIAGVFEDVPENTSWNLKYDMVVSLKSISTWWWDGSENWIGNDRYFSYVKLAQGVAPASLADQIIAMFERNADVEELEFLKKSYEKLEFSLVNIKDIHKEDVKTMLLLFGLLAGILLVTSILNYILVVISSLVNRTKEIAVHKCYGASGVNISKLLFAEAAIHLLVALLFSFVTILLLEDVIVNLLDTSLRSLFAPQILWVLAFVCVILLIITGLLPAYIFSKVPVTAAFQKARETHKLWKRVLIFVEVAATSFLIVLLVMFGLQYFNLANKNQGYSIENLLYVDNLIENPATRHNIVQELQKIPEVKMVSLCNFLPLNGGSGNNVHEDINDKVLFHIADFYWVDENYLSAMEIPLVEGKGFVKGETGSNVMMVSESFADKMAETAGWTDGVINKNIFVTEHGEQTICGVFGNILHSSFEMEPSIMLYDPEEVKPRVFLIKMHTVTPEIIASIYAVFEQFVPGQNILVNNYKEKLKKQFTDLKDLASEMLICGIVTLLIALAGLIGYIHNETGRRRAEIAIRKVHGATTNSIQGLFFKNILITVIPAIIVGIALAVVTVQVLQEYFLEKIYISIFGYTLCAVGIASIILVVISLNIYRAAARNPVENLE